MALKKSNNNGSATHQNPKPKTSSTPSTSTTTSSKKSNTSSPLQQQQLLLLLQIKAPLIEDPATPSTPATSTTTNKPVKTGAWASVIKGTSKSASTISPAQVAPSRNKSKSPLPPTVQQLKKAPASSDSSLKSVSSTAGDLTSSSLLISAVTDSATPSIASQTPANNQKQQPQEYAPINGFDRVKSSAFLQNRFNEQVLSLSKKNYYKPYNSNNWNVSINSKKMKENNGSGHANIKKLNVEGFDVLSELNKNR